MKTLLRGLAIAALFAIPGSPVNAQGITGHWIAEFDRTVRNENGNVSTGDRIKVRLTLQQRGDSVTGTLEPVGGPTDREGRVATPRQLRGTISGNRVSLSTEAEARRNINGEESVQRVTVFYDLTLDGDKLAGTIIPRTRDIEMPARPFSARREKP